MRQRTSFLVGEAAFRNNMDGAAEPTIFRLVVSAVVVVAMLLTALVLGW
jgi:predicted RND superfamily exporter protein